MPTWTHRHLRSPKPSAVLAAIALVTSAACSDPQAPQVEELATLTIDVPPSVPAGAPFTLVVEAVGDQGTRPLTSFNGTVSLSASAGTIDPASVTIRDGRGSVTASVGPSQGFVTLQAETGAVSSTVDLEVGPAQVLAGAASDPAVEAIPALDFEADPTEYVDDHPDLPGLSVSFRIVLVAIDASATVGEVNDLLSNRGAAVVAGFPGVDGRAAGILVLRMPFDGHDEMDAFLEELEASEIVIAAAPDSRSVTTSLPNPQGAASGWIWDGDGSLDGNWGLEMSRVPQMWNLNEALEARGDPVVDVGVFDAGFFTHPDVVFATHSATQMQDAHGTHVAGIIGASHDNGIGIDGVTPFARLHVDADTALAYSLIFSGIRRLSNAGARVINLSLGERWASVHPLDAPRRVAHVRAHAGIFQVMALSLNPFGEPPLFVAGAGNDSDDHPTPVDAIYSSPWGNAALEQGFRHVIVTEAVERNVRAATQTSRAEFSNPGGHLSAPGVHILSTVDNGGYDLDQGTSMAAPFVAGLAAYLLSVEPTLSNEEIRDVLTRTALPVDPTEGVAGSDRVDAFAAVLDIDRIRGGDRVLRMLLDVDDGTPDGNMRVDPADGSTPLYDDDVDGNGRPGDGLVDMADFRRWRDHWLDYEEVTGRSLDGPEDHPKRDLNDNGLVVGDPDETLYPVLDFNGDGALSYSASAEMSGYLAGTGPRTDLEVLQALFDDPDYQAEDLPELLESGDVQVQLSGWVVEWQDQGEVWSAIESVNEDGSAVEIASRFHDEDEPLAVYTLQASELPWRVSSWVSGPEGDTICIVRRDVVVGLGTDEYWTPSCGRTLEVEVGLSPLVDPGVPEPLIVRAGISFEGGPVRYQAGLDVAIRVTGGSVGVLTGTTNEDGFFGTTATLDAESPAMTVTVDVSEPSSGVSGQASATAVARPAGGRVVAQEFLAQLMVGAFAGDAQCSDLTDVDYTVVQTESWEATHSCSADAQGQSHFANVSASGTLGFDRAADGTDLVGVTVTMTHDASDSATGLASSLATLDYRLHFSVSGGPVSFDVSGAGAVDSGSVGFALYRPGDYLNPVWEGQRASGGRIAELIDSGTLEPGAYELAVSYSGYRGTGQLSFTFTMR